MLIAATSHGGIEGRRSMWWFGHWCLGLNFRLILRLFLVIGVFERRGLLLDWCGAAAVATAAASKGFLVFVSMLRYASAALQFSPCASHISRLRLSISFSKICLKVKSPNVSWFIQNNHQGRHVV